MLLTIAEEEWRAVTHEASEEYLRSRPEVVYPHLLPPFLPIGVTVIYGAAGTGKSMLAQQIEHCLAYGVPLGGLLPESPVRCLVMDLEGNRILTQQRSLNLLPYGSLPTDMRKDLEPWDTNTLIQYKYYQGDLSRTLAERVAHLEDCLTGAEGYHNPYGYVRLDTMRLFLGANSKKDNAYEWDAMHLRMLNDLALRHRLAMLLVHHPNKSGDVSGSVAVAGTAVQLLKLERTRGSGDGVLWSEKNRTGAEFSFPIEMVEGGWQFTDKITVDQARHTGAPRAVLDYLVEHGAATKQELIEATDLPEEAIKKATFRLKCRGIIDFMGGMWTFTGRADLTRQMPADTVAQDPPEGAAPGAQIPAPRSSPDDAGPDDDDATEEAEAEAVARHLPSAYTALRKSIETSKKHPVPNIRKEERDRPQWVAAQLVSDGRHRWKSSELVEYPDKMHVVVLDDNGRYPAACSSIPVCANVLKPSGPMKLEEHDNSLAGIFEIRPLPWPSTKIGHPLGIRAERAAAAGRTLWVASPNLRHMLKEGMEQGWTGEILDSHTGPSATNLFEDYYRWVRDLREEHRADQDAYDTVKRRTSMALRALFPKRAKSPFWRPDWYLSMTEEANLRHWAAAAKAVKDGAQLLALLNCDETVLLKPACAIEMPDWAPGAYRVGLGFGEVKIKQSIPYSQWRGSHGSDRAGK